jgi:hypothetical protein
MSADFADFVEPLNDLVGSTLYTVTFVLDYLKLGFYRPQCVNCMN